MAFVKQYCLFAKGLYSARVMRDKEYGDALFVELPEAANAFMLKVCVAYGKGLVNNQDLWVQAGGHREAKPHIHAGGICSERLIHEVAELGEANDVGHFCLEFVARETKQSAIEHHVLAPGELRVKSHAQLQQCSHLALHTEVAGAWFGRARKNLKQCGFPCTINTNNADGAAASDVKCYIAESPEIAMKARGCGN
ncbi:hypothetical protein ES707_13593 [subsurface metagenome]